MLVLAGAGGAFYFLSTGDEGPNPEDGIPTFDPQAPYDETDPVAVVNRMKDAYYAGDCEAAAAMAERPIWTSAGRLDRTPQEDCEEFYSALDAYSLGYLVVERQSTELLYEDGDFALVAIVEDVTMDNHLADDVIEEKVETRPFQYVLVRSGDTWLIAMEKYGSSLTAEDMTQSGLDELFDGDPPVPSP